MVFGGRAAGNFQVKVQPDAEKATELIVAAKERQWQGLD